MESKQHKVWKQELYEYLRGRISGCIGCAFGHDGDGHSPTYKAGSPATGFGRQLVIWPCVEHGYHTYDLLRGAGWIEIERTQKTPNGLSCRPDVAVLDTHYRPMAFLEVVNRHRPGNSLKVAEELDIPVFEIAAPKERMVESGLLSQRRWWEVVPGVPESERLQKEYIAEIGEEVMGRNNPDVSGEWLEMDRVYLPDGKMTNTIRFSEAKLSAGRFPIAGGMIWAKSCSWDCKRVIAVEKTKRIWTGRIPLSPRRPGCDRTLGTR